MTVKKYPSGVSSVITPMSGGTGNPDIATAIAVMGDDQYNVICNPYIDAANLVALEAELDSRFGPLKQNEGSYFSANTSDHATVGSFW